MATQTQTNPAHDFERCNPCTTTAMTFDKQKVIPVMSQVVTDEDIGLFQDTRLQRISLPKVVKLLTDPHSANLCERHVQALKKVVKHYSDGFLMKELVLVFRILNACADGVAASSAYVEPMSDLLRLCSLSHLKEKVSDELVYEQIAVECMEQFGYLMRVSNSRLRLQICDTLRAFYCHPEKSQLQSDGKYKPNSVTYNQHVVNKSNVAETLVKSLALVENDFDVKMAIFDLLQRLSKNSAANCNRMLNANCAYRLCSRLCDYDPTHQLVFRSVEILWNLLDSGFGSPSLAAQLSHLLCMSQLRDAFIYQLTQGFSHFDRQLRNDLLVIVSRVATICPDAPIIQVGFAKQLAIIATFQEVKTHNVLVKHLKLSPNHEDFELKKLLVNLLVIMSQDAAILPIFSECHVLEALFSYVRINEKVGPRLALPSHDWTATQFEEIQLGSIAALCTLAPRMLADYQACHGGTRLLLMLEWCIIDDGYAGFGNGFHASGGCGNKRAHLRHCLRLIRAVVSTQDESVLNDLSDQGAINQFVCLLEQFQSGSLRKRDAKADDAIDIEMQCDLLVILSIICQFDVHRKDLFGAKGVEVINEYLRMDLRLLASGLGHNRLLLCAIQTAWCTIVGSYMMEELFLEKEGIFLLLDLLESCPSRMRGLLVGCLLDLMENQKTASHVSVWRGAADNSTAPHLFCELWREEERRVGVHRELDGVIADAENPLSARSEQLWSIVPLPASYPSPAIVDVSENIRAKLYGIFSKIGFVELPGLTTEDHVTMTIVEHYMDLKAGEVWTEVMSELAEEQVRPVTPDREALEAISAAIRIRAGQVVEVQRELLEAQKQQDLMDEQEYYAKIRETYRQREREMKNFADLISRTSKHSLLKAAKQRQALSVDASRTRKHVISPATFHSTELPSINVTTFCQRQVAVESTLSAITGGALAHYDPTTGTIKRP